MTTSLYGTSYSSIYSKELKNIRAEQEAEEERLEAQKEGLKVIGAGGMMAGAYIGKGAKTLASKKLEEAAQFVMDDKVQSIKKFEGVAGETPEMFGKIGNDLFESFESYTGLELGSTDWGSWKTGFMSPMEGSTTQLTSEYITAGIESGKGVAELGIGKLFEEGAKSGTEAQIITEKGHEIGSAILGDKGAITTTFAKGGVAGAVKESSAASAGAVAGQVAAGVGIATGGYQAISGFAEGDIQSGVAGTAKAVGGAMMFTPLAPIGLALTGVGTLLDFV